MRKDGNGYPYVEIVYEGSEYSPAIVDPATIFAYSNEYRQRVFRRTN
jgi:hypothetical protein